MKKMINKTFIEGLLVEKNFRTGMTKANVAYIAGKLHIDTGNNNIVVVDVFEQQRTAKGLENQKYAILSGIYKNGQTVNDGSATPTAIRVSSTLELNDWMDDGQQKTSLINNGGFINIISNQSNQDWKAEFEVDIVIKNVQPELKDAVETGRAIINGYVFNYKNHALPVRFIVENKQGVSFFTDMEPNTFTRVWGVQSTGVSGVDRKEESAFGDAKVVKSGYTRKEFIVIGAQTFPYSEEELTQAELSASIQARNIVLAEKFSTTQVKPKVQVAAPKTSTFNF
jgi:hypothetical protein